MRLLDLYCAAGGASEGYARAGFEVMGVDVLPQPRYPFRFIQGDALRPPVRLEDFDLIHASPPCQRYSRISAVHDVSKDHPDLVAPTREMLLRAGVPYIMENVPGSPLAVGVILCGSQFGLSALCHDGIRRQLRRHRWFESDLLFFEQPCAHEGEPIGVYGHGGGEIQNRLERRGESRVHGLLRRAEGSDGNRLDEPRRIDRRDSARIYRVARPPGARAARGDGEERKVMAVEGEGWGKPAKSVKFHYFRDLMSLCGGWGFYRGPLEIGFDESAENCALCRRKKAKEPDDRPADEE